MSHRYEKQIELIQRRRDAHVKAAAATLIQAHVRRKAARAEVEAAKAKERLEDVYKLANVQMAAAQDAAAADRISSKFRDEHMTCSVDGQGLVTMRHALQSIVNSPQAQIARDRVLLGGKTKFKYVRELVCGRPEAAALGIVSILKVRPPARNKLLPRMHAYA